MGPLHRLLPSAAGAGPRLYGGSPLARAATAALAAALFTTAFLPSPASAKTQVVASIPDLGSIASSVGGDEVEVAAICRPNADAHRVEVLPSYMVRVSRAKIYLKVGLFLDQWADQIIDGSHNGDLIIVDCSSGIRALEVPSSPVNASMGDVHPNGNPHYWLDPRNGAVIARTVADALSKVDPAHAADYSARAEAFARECEAKAEEGRAAAAELGSKEIITYHRSWTYLADAFGLEVVGTVEPVPGIPPTAKHLEELVGLIREHRVPVLLYESYFSGDAGDFLGRQTPIVVAKVSPSCEDASAGSYLLHFDRLIDVFSSAKNGAD